MNFIEEFKKGQKGGNKGIPLGKGLKTLSNALNGIQRSRIVGIAAPSKVGKSTLADHGFVIQPYLYALENDIPIEWIYFSFEIGRIAKEYDFAAYFMYHDHNILNITLPEGITHKGKNTLVISADYLRGRILDDNGQVIKVSTEIAGLLKIVYDNRIVPLFGEFSPKGELITKGKIIFIEEKDNPTGLYKYLKRHAEKKGKFIRRKMGEKLRIVGYKPNNPKLYTIIVTDHLRKLLPERGWKKKEVIDKYIEYSVELRNWCDYTFIHIIHLNRSLGDIQRMKEFGDLLFPTSDDIKDTGNLAEEADYVLTMFDPNDTRYNLQKHFGERIKDSKDNPIYPYMRTIHIVENRHGPYPQHFRFNMNGAIKDFEILKIGNDTNNN